MAILWVSTGPCLNTATVEFVKVSRVPCIKMNRLFNIIYPLWTKVFGNPKGVWMPTFMGVIIPFCELVSNMSTVFCTWCAATASAMSLGWTELAPSVIRSKHKVLPEENPKQKTPEENFQRCFVEALEAGNLQEKTQGFFEVPRWKLMNLYKEMAGKSKETFLSCLI